MQPPTDFVEPLQVNVAEPATVQEPLQVMLQVPLVHETLEPAPTLCVQLLPLQLTLQAAPQFPVQVEPALQDRLQLLVELSHSSNEHVEFAGQSQFLPAQ